MVEVLSRVQFGLSIGFHILFPTLNLGLALFLVISEVFWLSTKKTIYLKICQFWTKIFALTFGMGVVSGIVMAYQIGTNFGPFITQFGNVLGALFAYETLTAFFLEAGFLGVMLFGWKRVPPIVHFMATLLVTIGTTISAFWILSANSWMQTPAGYDLVHGKYIVSNWWQVVFNPSFLPRLAHMLLASYTTTCFVLAGVASYYLRKNVHLEVARKSLSWAMWAALVIVPLQIYMGDRVGLVIHHYQPIKTAAIEGLWETQRGAPLVLLGLPSQEKERNDYSISIPKAASLINTHEWDGELMGLKAVSKEERPRVLPVFIAFRVMVGIGLLMLVIALWGAFLRIKKSLYRTPSFHRLCLFAAPLGFVATILGWITAEMGRQPWVVHNLMRTKEAVSAVGADEVLLSLTLLIITYGIVFSFYLYYVTKLIRKGPESLMGPEYHAFQYMTDMKGGVQ